MKLLVEIDVTKPLLRGTTLKFKQNETWIQFKYEQLPFLCYYCGCIGNNEMNTIQRKHDLRLNVLKENQYGSWLRVGLGRSVGDKRVEIRGESIGKDRVLGSDQVLNEGAPLGVGRGGGWIFRRRT